MVKNTLNMYTVYDSTTGPQEGAVLAFAHTAHEARVITFGRCDCLDFCSYIETGVSRIQGCEWLRKEAVQEGPHFIYPKFCTKCGTWGNSEIVDGLCENCRASEENKED